MTCACAFEGPVEKMKAAADAKAHDAKMIRWDFINSASFLYFVIL
jgi:hypothetical protein